MSGVKLLTVSADEGEQRLDKWFKRRFPQISQGHVEKMCRTGQVRIDSARAADRKSQVGSGDRSERIRTYNFPQGRMTDHRINLTLYSLPQIMGGDLTEVIDALTAHDQAAKLAEMEA